MNYRPIVICALFVAAINIAMALAASNLHATGGWIMALWFMLMCAELEKRVEEIRFLQTLDK